MCLRFSTGVEKLEINIDKLETNNENSVELPKQLPHG